MSENAYVFVRLTESKESKVAKGIVNRAIIMSIVFERNRIEIISKIIMVGYKIDNTWALS